MWRGLYTAANGMITEMVRTSTIANNLANANTTGYKRDRAIDKEFEPVLIHRINDQGKIPITQIKQFGVDTGGVPIGQLGLGAYTTEVATDHAQGSLMTTGNQLDVGISGEGYFAIDTPDGVRYTRNGNFHRQTDGTLVTSDGLTVRGQGGRNIVIPDNATYISIGAQGDVHVDGAQIGQLELVQFNDRNAVLKQGDSLYYAQEGAQPQAATGNVIQGVLERSNSNVVNEMVDLIVNQRTYDANAKALTSEDDLLAKATTEVGKV